MLKFRQSFHRCFSSAYKRPNNIRLKTEAFQNVLSNDARDIDWETVRRELIASERSVSSGNVDGIIIGLCSREHRLDIAKSYVEFMKKSSKTINDASVGKLLRLFYHNKVHQKNSISAEDEEEILKFCGLLVTKYPVMNGDLLENIIHGLCLTRDWMKSLEMLTQFGISGSVPSASSFNCILFRSLEEDKLDIAWRLVNQMTSQQITPKPSILVDFLGKFKNDAENSEKLLNLIKETSLMLPEKSIEEFRAVFGEKCKIATVDRGGKCSSCRNKLSGVELNEKEFAKLCGTFLDDVLIRKDVFLKSSPDEVSRFKKFIEKTAPYDCVIDGLNVAYSHGVQQGPQMFAKNVALVVKYFADRKDSMLVIGRKHMNGWPKKEMDFIRRNSSLFLADNLSQDDPFMLYAALKSGPNTKIFSRDLMRSHSHLLDDESKKLFRRWQQQQQFSLITTLQNNEILVREPIGFDVRAHKVGSHWHVPFTIENLQFTYESFEVPAKWLCVDFS